MPPQFRPLPSSQDAAAAAQESTFNGIQLLPGGTGFCVTVSDGRVLFYEVSLSPPPLHVHLCSPFGICRMPLNKQFH